MLPTVPSRSHFYPRSPRGERQYCGPDKLQVYKISIHAPREGSDQWCGQCFLSLPISIHAPREGSDFCEFVFDGVDVGISIHAPREGSDRDGVHAAEVF